DEAAVTDAQVAEIEAMVATASGIDAARGDAVVVSRLPFDTSAAESAAAEAEAAAAADQKSDRMALYRTLAIVGVAVLALLLAYASTRRARRVVNTPIALGEITGHQPHESPPPLMVEGGDDPAYLPVTPGGVQGAVAVKELAELAEQRPEDVASVLKTWLAEAPRDRR
ncbi:MAG: flagellar M-ring protein FliF C-terminal domain-containing protein, partial [Ilumatobacteraceae bacterium]